MIVCNDLIFFDSALYSHVAKINNYKTLGKMIIIELYELIKLLHKYTTLNSQVAIILI